MNNLSIEACNFLKNLMHKYLVDLDYDAMRNSLHQNITCIGSGLDELWNGFEDACTKIELKSRFDNTDFAILDEWYDSQILSDTDVVIHGEVQLQKVLPNNDTTEVRFRLTAVCRYENNQFLLLHMHFSLPISGGKVQSGKTESSIREHRSQLADKVQELLDLTNGIKGGVEICKVDDGYTIQYLSNGFKDLLLYSEEELATLIGLPHRTLIYENDDDYKKIVETVDEQLLDSDGYTIEYRMIQKGGQYIWVLESGRIVEENGEKNLRCLIVDIHKQKTQEHELALSKKRYELAMKATKVQMFEFDIETQDIYMFPGDAQQYGIPTVLKNAGEDLISHGLLSPLSIGVLKEAFKSVTAGSSEAECDIAVKIKNNEYTNFNVSMTTGFSESGEPLFAIGVIKDIQEIVELQQESKLSKTLIENRKLGTFEVNVTTNKVVSNTAYNNKMEAVSSTYTYTNLMNVFVDKHIHEDDKKNYVNSMSLEALRSITDFESTVISLQYRRINDDRSEYRWWSISGRLYQDSHTGEIKAFFYEEDVHDQKEQEMTLRFDAEHDKMTGYYNKESSEKYIRAFISDIKNTNEEHALFIIDLDYFKNINDTFGHAYGDSVLIEVTRLIKQEFRSTDIIGRIGGDECAIFMKSILNRNEVKEKAEKICSILKKTYSVENTSITISASIGIAFTSECNSDYDNLFAQADKRLYTSKRNGRNTFTM